MATITTATLQALQTANSQIFKRAYSRGPEHHTKLALTVNSSSAIETYGWMEKVPQMREWLGPRVVQNLTTLSTQIVNRDFELTVGADRNDIEDDTLGLFRGYIEDMAEQAKYHPTTLVLDLMRNGHVAGNVGFDGQVFFSATHDLDPAGNQSNVGSTALSATAWEDTRATMRQYTDNSGRVMNVNPDLIIVPPQLEGTIKAILTAERNANGSTNINRGEASYMVIPELGDDANDWYVLDTTRSGIRPFIYQNRKSSQMVARTALTDDNVFNLRKFLWGVDSRGAAGYGPWWLAFKHVVA